jgi:hypothetical protein
MVVGPGIGHSALAVGQARFESDLRHLSSFALNCHLSIVLRMPINSYQSEKSLGLLYGRGEHVLGCAHESWPGVRTHSRIEHLHAT